MRRILTIMAVSISMILAAATAQAHMAGAGGMSNGTCMGEGAGMMGGNRMMMRGGMMAHPMMHGMMERGMMMGGLPQMTPEMRSAFMRAMMKTMIRSALQTPEIKGFLDSTVSLRRELVLKRFEFFEAFRNPMTTPAHLEKLKSEIRALEKRIDEKMTHPQAAGTMPSQ
ncbi:MAG: hypothetical protein M0Z58_06345 [Nitrospiraceae bacterium]|nr:hypothetical protein [Nitrospiraceae bacterium]